MGLKLVRGNKKNGTLENTFRAIRRATSEDSDHLPMHGQSDFAICGDKQACKLQFLERLQISVKFITVSVKFKCIMQRLIWVYTVF